MQKNQPPLTKSPPTTATAHLWLPPSLRVSSFSPPGPQQPVIKKGLFCLFPHWVTFSLPLPLAAFLHTGASRVRLKLRRRRWRLRRSILQPSILWAGAVLLLAGYYGVA